MSKDPDPALAQFAGGIGDRPAGIDDVVDEQYRPPGEAGRDIAKKLHRATALFGETVARSCMNSIPGRAPARSSARARSATNTAAPLSRPTMTNSAGSMPAISVAIASIRAAISAALNRTRNPSISSLRESRNFALLLPFRVRRRLFGRR